MPNLPWERARTQAIPAPKSPTTQGLRVAVVLPLSGDNAALGKAMLNAAILASYDIKNQDITLLPMDQNRVLRNPNLLAQSKINVVVGPLTAAATRQLQPTARANHIRMFSLSNDTALADTNTVVMGYRVQSDIVRMMSFAVQKNKTRILAIVPRDAYGDAVASTLQSITTVQVQMLRYTKPDDLPPAIKAITDPPDAVFLPIKGTALPFVVKTLAGAGMTPDRVQYLGTGLWDDSDTRKIPELQGAWYPSTNSESFMRLSQRYQAQYGAPPPRLATLSYNTVALISMLEKQSGSDAFHPNVLHSPAGFDGVDGLFRILPDGTVRRALAVVEIRNQHPVTLDRAPDSAALAQ